METTGYLIARAAELTTCMQDSEDDLECRLTSLLLNVDRNASTIILYSDGIILLDGDGDAVTETRQRLINGVVHDLIDEMMETTDGGAADIHARSLPNCFESFQNLNLICAIIRRALHELLFTLQIFIFIFFYCH